MKTTLLIAVVVSVFLAAASPAQEPIRHRFLLKDESRHLLHYVDEANPSAHWAIPLDPAARDLQLIGGNRVLVSHPQGYSVFDLATQKSVKEFRDARFGGTMSVRRRPDGSTLLGGNQGQKGVCVFQLDRDDRLVRQMSFPALKALRLLRPTGDGHVLLGEEEGVTEAEFDSAAENAGRIVRRLKLPRPRNAYMALKDARGHYLVSGGYAKAWFDFAPDGQVVREFVLKDLPAGMTANFFSGFQVLKNGHVVVTHWTGHAAEDSRKAWQVVEFDAGGKIVWHWHDPALAGTAHGIIVLDGLDTAVLQDDASGVLGE